VDRSVIYDSIDENQKTLRRTLLYGVTLGFLEQEGDVFRLTRGAGSGLAWQDEFGDKKAIKELFRGAIERYEPYRDAIAGVYAASKVDDLKGNPAVVQESFGEELRESVEGEVKGREINVLIKTADAAGLGKYVAGRRGYQTRLELSDEFEPFASRLADEYRLPGEEEGEEEPGEEKTEEDQQEQDTELVQQPLSEGVNVETAGDETGVNVHIHVSEKSNDEIVSLVRRLNGGDE